MWADNGLDLEMPHIIREACKFGDGYLYVWPNPDDETKVDVYWNSPLTTRVIYDEENPRRKRFAIKRWTIGGGRQRCDLLYTDRVERYVAEGSGPGRRPRRGSPTPPTARTTSWTTPTA